MSPPPPDAWASAFLANIATAWDARCAAIGNKGRIVGASRFGPSHDDTDERLVLALAAGPHQRVTIVIRDTRRIDIVAAEGVPEAWAWQFADAGRLAGDGPALIAAIEQTLAACAGMTAEATGAFDAIWRPVLAKGPRRIA